ncbi:MAG: hypothetical protein VX111_14850 [Planctomycetota bacterium]|nr:hypothetical protein [Planctomycetota bacterium]
MTHGHCQLLNQSANIERNFRFSQPSKHWVAALLLGPRKRTVAGGESVTPLVKANQLS